MPAIYGPRCHAHGITGYGNPENGVVLVGIAPGKIEVRQGIPFVGPSGKVLDGILEACDFPRSGVYTTNAICWWKDHPEPHEVAACGARFWSELRGLTPKPRLVIPLGDIATQAVTGKTIKGVRGAVMWDAANGWYVMPTYHPAAIFRTASLVVDIVRDLDKIKRVLTWPMDGTAEALYKYQVVRTHEEAQALIDEIPTHELAVLDVETTIPDDNEKDEESHHGRELLCFSVTTEDGLSNVVPYELLDGLVWPDGMEIDGWGLQFDVQVIREKYGSRLRIREDGMLMSYSLDERPGYHKLKPSSREYFGVGHYEDETKKRKGKAPTTPEQWEELYKYNGGDTNFTYKHIQFFKPRQEEDDVRSLYTDLLIPAANCYADIQFRGVRIDNDAVAKHTKKWVPRYIKRERMIQAMAQEVGWPHANFNAGSPQQLSKLLFDPQYLGLTGGPSTERSIIEELEGQHPIIEHVLDHKRDKHVITHYLEPLARARKEDGRAHAAILVHGQRTGRRSIKNPPEATIPKDQSVGGDLAQIREVFVATNEDYVLYEFDFKQIEAWLAWHFSQDDAMLEDLMSGDYHGSTAQKALGAIKPPCHCSPPCADEILWNKWRYQAKKVNYGIMYGEQAKGLSSKRKGIGTTVEVAQIYLDAILGRYRGLDKYMRLQERLAIENGELVSTTGRKRRFKVVLDRHSLRQALNFNIQATAGDCTLDSLIKLHPLLKAMDSHILIEIHDSLLVEINRKYEREATQLIKSVMEESHFGLPSIKVDAKRGMNWYAMEEAEIAA